jgi:hypothetical protein
MKQKSNDLAKIAIPVILFSSFNPGTLIDLNSQQAKTTNTKIVIRKPIFYTQRSKSKDSSKSSIVKPAKYQNGPGQVLKFLQTPILASLTASSQNQNAASDHIPRKTMVKEDRLNVGKR